MKKILSVFVFAAIGCLTFSSCEPEEVIGEIVNDIVNEMGTTEITIVDNNGGTYSLDTVFHSSVTDVISQTIQTTDGDVFVHAALALCTNVDVMSSTVVGYPFCGIRITDTVAGVYPITNIFTPSILLNMNVNSMLTGTSDNNLIVLAVSDTAFYVATAGAITFTSYPGYGRLAEGSFSNVQGYYFTQSTLDNIESIILNASLSGNFEIPEEYFHPVTMSGTISCRRMNITRLVNSLAQEE